VVKGDPPALLERVELALALIRDHDARRYRAIRRCLSRIWVRLLPGPCASFSAAAKACQLDTRYVADPAVTPEELATSIVHEAAHARIDRCVPYRADLRHRIEAACRREELAFARRLPAGAAIAERTEAWLAAPPSTDFWSDAAFRDRWLEGSLENLRHAGLPEWLLRGLRRSHALASAVRKRYAAWQMRG
jgi:hypothetical protein